MKGRVAERMMSRIHRCEGGCHCGNLAFVFEASVPLSELGLRTDGCSFCRAHGARHTSDPKGSVTISVRDADALVRYRFGHRTADFLICGRCGVYIGALMADGGQNRFVINANALRPPPADDCPVVPVDFEGEAIEVRTARRKQRWTPLIAFSMPAA